MSIVKELQKEIIEDKPLSKILLKAKVIAWKLNDEERLEWIDHEINGYTENDVIPEYRKIKGELKALNPYHVWQPALLDEKDSNFENPELRHNIAEIESLVEKTKSSGSLSIQLPPSTKKKLMEYFNAETDFMIQISHISLTGILSKTKNLILDWTLKLEKKGILGEGLEFSEDDQKKSKSIPTVNIYNNIKNQVNNEIKNNGSIAGFIGQNNGKVNIQNINEKVSAYITELNSQIENIPELDEKEIVLIKQYSREIEDSLSNPVANKRNTIISSKLKKIAATLSSSVASNMIASGLIKVANELIKIL